MVPAIPTEPIWCPIYRLPRGFEAFTTLHNITNHHYATIYDSSAFPGEPFRGIAGLRWRH